MYQIDFQIGVGSNQKTILDIIKMPETEYSLEMFEDVFSKVEVLKKSDLKNEIKAS
jgi:hypothetical protein